MILGIIIYVLWMLMFLSLAIQSADSLYQLGWAEMFMVLIIFLVTAPAFFISNIAAWALDLLMGDNWDGSDDNDIKFN
jgi:hypothetical protein